MRHADGIGNVGLEAGGRLERGDLRPLDGHSDAVLQFAQVLNSLSDDALWRLSKLVEHLAGRERFAVYYLEDFVADERRKAAHGAQVCAGCRRPLDEEAVVVTHEHFRVGSDEIPPASPLCADCWGLALPVEEDAP